MIGLGALKQAMGLPGRSWFERKIGEFLWYQFTRDLAKCEVKFGEWLVTLLVWWIVLDRGVFAPKTVLIVYKLTSEQAQSSID